MTQKNFFYQKRFQKTQNFTLILNPLNKMLKKRTKKMLQAKQV
jgi:hypothetical protein